MKNKKVVVKDKVSAAAPKFFDASGGEVRDQASHQAAREVPVVQEARVAPVEAVAEECLEGEEDWAVKR